MIYHRETGLVEYQSKNEEETRVFDGLEWLAAVCFHITDKGEQMVRYGACPPWRSFYSNVYLQAQSKPVLSSTIRYISALKIPAILDFNHRLVR